MPYSPDQPRDSHGRFASKGGLGAAKRHLSAHAGKKLAVASHAYSSGLRTGVAPVDLALKAAHHAHTFKQKHSVTARFQYGKHKVKI